MNNSPYSIAVLRTMLLVLLLLYAAAIYLQTHIGPLSSVTSEYMQEVRQVSSGMSLRFFFQRILWVLGNVVGLLGAVLMGIRFRVGIYLFGISAPILWVATVCGAGEPAFPDVESLSGSIAWQLVCAAWGAVTMYGVLGRELFVQPH